MRLATSSHKAKFGDSVNIKKIMLAATNNKVEIKNYSID